MYKLINDTFKINYSQEQKKEAGYYAEVFNRILCIVAGFSAETFDLDFAFIIPSGHPEQKLSLYKNGSATYIGLYNTKTKDISLNTDVENCRYIDSNTIDYLLKIFRENEKFANKHHKYMPALNIQHIQQAWISFISINKIIQPTLRNYINIDKKEMSVRQFYEMSVAKPREEFICWVFSKNPSEEDKKRMLSILVDKIFNLFKENTIKESIKKKQQSNKKASDIER